MLFVLGTLHVTAIPKKFVMIDGRSYPRLVFFIFQALDDGSEKIISQKQFMSVSFIDLILFYKLL